MNILNYNLHPILVHFPIALLSLYCFFEIISWGKLRSNWSFGLTKGLLATIGGISLLVARQYGDVARGFVTDASLTLLIHRHKDFADYSVVIFGIIGVGYLARLMWMYFEAKNLPSNPLWKLIYFVQRIVTDTGLIKLLAIAGFVLLAITGALGGSIVYGANSDPFTAFIYRIFY